MTSKREKEMLEFIHNLLSARKTTRKETIKHLYKLYYKRYKSINAIHNRINRLIRSNIIVYSKGFYVLTQKGRDIVARNLPTESEIFHQVEYHKVWVSIPFLKDNLENIETQQKWFEYVLDRWGFPHKKVNLRHNSYYIFTYDMSDYPKFRIHNNKLMIHPEPILADTVQEAVKKVREIIIKELEKIAKYFNLKFKENWQMSISYSSRHFAILETEIAKLYQKERWNLTIFDEADGRRRVVIDFSKGVPHFEAVHRIKSPEDAKYFKDFFDDMCKEKPPKLSIILERLNKVERRK